MDSFKISVVDGVKESEQGKLGVYVTSLITYKSPILVNRKLVIVPIAL